MSDDPLRELELSPEAMRAMISQAADYVVRHVETLGTQPMHATAGGRKLARALVEPMPERGVAYSRLLRTLFGRIIPVSLNTASPGYLAYIPGGGLFHSAIADLIADATNRYVGVFQAAPGLVALESNVVRWFCDALGLPAGAGGVLTTGGSMANLIATVTARRERLPPDFLRGTIYTSDQAHHSVQKAALIAGFPPENVREVPSGAGFRVDVSAMATAIERDRAAGMQPFLVVGHAGTTNTGAVDDLTALADLCAREKLWFHVDGAYGGFFALTSRGKIQLTGIERADSITLDPHKGLFLPYGTGCLLVRERDALRRAHAVHAAYLPPPSEDADLPDYSDLSPELSRDARGLRVWLPLKMHGAQAFRTALDEKLDLARYAADQLARIPGLEVVAAPQLSLLAFRVTRPGLDEAGSDALTRRVLSGVNSRQRVLLTGTVTRGRFLARICVLSFRTHRDRIDMALEDITAALRDALAE